MPAQAYCRARSCYAAALFAVCVFASPVPAAQPAEVSPSFSRDVVAVLTKAGCNGGSCHGSFQGRGGFRLSLLGFDPLADYEAIVLQGRGRRVTPSAPEMSLLLRKPTAAVPHGGGGRLNPDSEAYRIVQAWIRDGLAAPTTNDARVSKLVVTPAEVVIRPGEKTQLNVQALWSDDSTQQASAWVLYESTEDKVAEISKEGVVTALQPGRATIMIRYLGQVAAVAVTVPYGVLAEGPAFPRNNYVDDHIIAEWQKLQLQPAPLADDAEFVRRVYLDLIGTLPTVDEVKTFLTSTAADKRSQLIDQLLERPEYVDYWSLKWGDLLRAHRRYLGEKGLTTFNGWLRQALRENRPMDRIARELLTAQGNLYQNGPVAFFYVDQTPQDLAETTAQIFLGVRMQCAKCHHHPYEVWSQDDYYGLAATFARIQRKDTKENGGFGGAQSIRLASDGKLTHPSTGETVAARALGQVPISSEASVDPRQSLAEWITSKDNPYFARNLVNRCWGHLFGRGLVEPIDDLRATNPASHPALFDALAADFVAHQYDLKHLLRTMCNSRAYQLASEVVPTRDANTMFVTHHRPRRMPAEVLLDAINQAAGVQEGFDEAGRGRFGVTLVPPGTHAIALPDPTVISYFLDVFGRPNRTSTCECDRGSRSDLSQVLHLANGDKLHQKVSDPQGRVARLLAAKQADEQVIEELYLAAFCRLPTVQERAEVAKLVAKAPARQEGLQDLLWALVNSAEFVFNH